MSQCARFHFHLFYQDLPCSWPWGLAADDAAAASALEVKGAGRGRGRGRRGKGGRKGSGKGKSETDTSEMANKKQKDQKKPPFLLTNLVRAGNQMGGSGSWALIGRALERLVDENLELLPMSQRPSDDRLRWNQDILKVLGKVPPDFDIVAFGSGSDSDETLPTKRNGVLESAIELLRLSKGTDR